MKPDVRRRWLIQALPGLSILGLAGCANSPQTGAPARALAAVPAFSSVSAGSAPPQGWRPYILRPDRVKSKRPAIPS